LHGAYPDVLLYYLYQTSPASQEGSVADAKGSRTAERRPASISMKPFYCPSGGKIFLGARQRRCAVPIGFEEAALVTGATQRDLPLSLGPRKRRTVRPSQVNFILASWMSLRHFSVS
jgi:hypothetical protein